MRARSRRTLPAALALALALALVACTVPADPSPGSGPPSSGAPSRTRPSWRAVDGGPDYYARFGPTLPAQHDWFPVGVWLESVVDAGDVALDRQAGLTTYVDLTANSDLSVLEGSGMAAMVGRDDALADGFVLADEVDMWAGPGDAPWTGLWPGQGEVCTPVTGTTGCGHTIQQTLRSGLPQAGLTYANYGKGVVFWLDDAEARRFVNDHQDVVSADTYWFTDPNICRADEGGAVVGGGRDLAPAECRRAANYGWTVERVRSLVEPAGSKPVWAFVELGHPASEDDAPTITGPQVRAAVWSSVIHGARGIVYFNHSFGGDCESFHLLREPCGDDVRPWVVEVNRQLVELAPALTAPFLDGAVAADGPVDTAVKVHGGEQYLLAAATDHRGVDVTFRLRCATDGPVTVLGEDRELALVDGAFDDHFADGEAVHLYRYAHAPGASRGCSAP
ncbi:hypothetical protein [Cellulomonas aerilata]|uniref:Glycoside hydrolase family 42 N-terminal domain-containing protein n=1 Tax=Cellulomonas aerilata TaxID=515326 RepID=A0A512DA40_9CELL|nr:hypothetical protein [Cellulomonas aerilata]GEO33331.1 hypothetical protein CAE01nite_10560 [Cellulomonas aerilata]